MRDLDGFADLIRTARGFARGFSGLLLVSVPMQSSAAPAEPARPSFVVILADDLGFSDLGCYGSEIPTPNLDSLATDGVRFTTFYNTGRCSPTRASLLTGLWPHQAGIGLLAQDRGHAGYRGVLSEQSATVAELLRDAGYRTGMVGKWHVGHERPHWPIDRGFESFYGTPRGGGFYFPPATGQRERVLVRGEELLPFDDPDWHATERFAGAAVDFLQGARDDSRPFFLYVALIAPHYPLQARPDDIDRHRGKYRAGYDAIRQARYRRMVQLGIIPPRWRPRRAREVEELWRGMTDQDRNDADERMAVYAAQVEGLDRAVGRILATLRELDLADDTIVMFLSDNGPTGEGGLRGFSRGSPGAALGTAESFASYGLAWARVSNTPFSGFKSWVNEGGVATPLIVSGARAVVEPGRVVHTTGHVVDLLPTWLELAGVTYPNARNGHDLHPIAGRSLLPQLRGDERESSPIFWEHRGNRAVRHGDWKLSALHGEPWKLYNVRTDRTETFDLSGAYADRVTALRQLYDEWADRVDIVPWTEIDDSMRDALADPHP